MVVKKKDEKGVETSEKIKVNLREISLSEDGTTLLSAGKDGRIMKWQSIH